MNATRLSPMAGDLRQRLQHTTAVNAIAERALNLSKTYLDRADRAIAAKQYFPADRFLAASESLRRVAENQNPENAAEMRKPPKPPFDVGPEPGLGHGPPPNGPHGPLPGDRMEHLYFRLQQADFFASEARDPAAVGMAQWAREFYQKARRAMERGDELEREINSRSAMEIVHALESLAQAAAPFPPRVPPGIGGPGRGGPEDRGPDGHGPPPGGQPGGPPRGAGEL
jgi:hypothetical protein